MSEQDSVPDGLGLILGIEAATPSGGVALASLDGRLLAHVWRADSSPIARYLLPDVDRILHENRIAPSAAAKAIKAVAVTRGPGAFTGLRLGLALAKTLAQGWGVPVYGYSTLEMLARRWPILGDRAGSPNMLIGVLLDARRGEIYSGLYSPGAGGRPQARREDRVETIQEFVQAAKATMDTLNQSTGSDGGLGNKRGAPTIALSGSGAIKYREALAEGLGDHATWIAPPWDNPAADAVALAGARDLREGRPGLDPLSVEPLYLRVSDAERRFGITAATRGPV